MKHVLPAICLPGFALLLSLTVSCSTGTTAETNTPTSETIAIPAVTATTQEKGTETVESTADYYQEEVEKPSDIDTDETQQEEIVVESGPDTAEEPENAPETGSLPEITPEIRGTEAFIEQTEQALFLLSKNDPESFLLIEQYVGIIDQGEHSGMWAYEDPPRYEVGDATAFYSVTWYAGTLVHDATHSKLYHNYPAENGVPVPNDIWTGTEAELICILEQIEALRAIGAPESEIEYLISLNGTHYDIDGDGDLDWDDYNNRDW